MDAPKTTAGPSAGGWGTAPAQPTHFSFSTQGLPDEGKFETWRDLWMGRLVECEVMSASPQTFEGHVDLWSAGPLSIAGVTVKSTIYDRTPTLARNGNSDFSLTLCGDGVSIRSTKTGEARVPRGGGFFLSHERQFMVEPEDDCYTCLLRIDRRHLLDLMPPNFELDMATVAPGAPILELIKGYVPLIMNKGDPVSQQARDMMGRHVIDLVALMLKPSGSALELVSSRGLKAARTKAVLTAIDRHFGDPTLSAETVGRELGISARQVHRLVEETTKTFYEHVLERRLQRAHELLGDPAFSAVKVADIARRAGFSDVTYFNRTFRIRFGDTPTGARNRFA